MNRVNTITDNNNLLFDQRDASLFRFQDYMHFYKYPVTTGAGTANCAGYVGDPYLVKIPFRILNTVTSGIIPLLQSVTISIIAVKAGKNDFIVETKTFNTSNTALFNNLQQVNFTQTKGYISAANDPYNIISLTNGAKYTDGSSIPWQTFMLIYPFVLRYDYWNALNTKGTDIGNDILNTNNDWTSLQQSGWSLVMRISSDVQGYDGFTTTFQAQSSIRCAEIGTLPDIALTYARQIFHYDDSKTYGTVIPSI